MQSLEAYETYNSVLLFLRNRAWNVFVGFAFGSVFAIIGTYQVCEINVMDACLASACSVLVRGTYVRGSAKSSSALYLVPGIPLRKVACRRGNLVFGDR